MEIITDNSRWYRNPPLRLNC